ncbi:MAG TPA: SRPBCC domain-containing protein [Actinomycetes bacterium]|jgi:uncharacterized protein YndB with AHSA1/START domain|nr:SRPBCC domain-containing protein [Actinomycetes bacterium]
MTSTTEPGTTTQVHRVYIKATPEAIWEAITKPEWTEQYLYESRVEYDLRPGGAYRAYPSEAMRVHGAELGHPIPDVVVDGEVVEADPPRKLVQTWRMLMDPTMAAEGFTRLTWELEELEGGVARLTVTHDLQGAPQLAALVSGAMEHEGAGGGWNEVLSGLKTLLETGKPLRG